MNESQSQSLMSQTSYESSKISTDTRKSLSHPRLPLTLSLSYSLSLSGTMSQSMTSSSSYNATGGASIGSQPSQSGIPGPGQSSLAGSRPAPRRGRGQLKQTMGPGSRIPICATCGTPIRGPFIIALGRTWCPEHFNCANSSCRRPLENIGFVEEAGQLYCESCFEAYLAPICAKCGVRIKGV